MKLKVSFMYVTNYCTHIDKADCIARSPLMLALQGKSIMVALYLDVSNGTVSFDPAARQIHLMNYSFKIDSCT